MSKLSRRAFLACLALTPIVALSILAAPSNADHHDACPRMIYIIRHAEKPDDSDDPNLAPRGYERAKALVHVIPDRFATPDIIIASAASKKSDRPVETITPLAASLHMEIHHRFKDDEFAQLAASVLGAPEYSGKTILICWHHGEIPKLARALGASTAPDSWSSDVFDRVWVLTYDHGQVVSFQSLPQKALPGDSQH